MPGHMQNPGCKKEREAAITASRTNVGCNIKCVGTKVIFIRL